MEVRAVDADLYMQLSTWEKPLAGCWLRTGPGQVPGGQLAMTPACPASSPSLVRSGRGSS